MGSSIRRRLNRLMTMMLQARRKDLAPSTKVEHKLSQTVGQTAFDRLADCDTRDRARALRCRNPSKISADGSEPHECCSNTQAKGQGRNDRKPEYDVAGGGR